MADDLCDCDAATETVYRAVGVFTRCTSCGAEERMPLPEPTEE